MKRKFPQKHQQRIPKNRQGGDLMASATRIIRNLAYRYSHYLAPTALATREDLEQEGWEVWCKILRKYRYNPDCAALTTLLHAAVTKRYNSILRYESSKGRSRQRGDFAVAMSQASTESDIQERSAMMVQALEAFAQINVRFAQLLVEGPPPGLLAEARALSRLRHSKHGRNPANYAVTITPKLIRDYFTENFKAFDTNMLHKLANNYLQLQD